MRTTPPYDVPVIARIPGYNRTASRYQRHWRYGPGSHFPQGDYCSSETNCVLEASDDTLENRIQMGCVVEVLIEPELLMDEGL